MQGCRLATIMSPHIYSTELRPCWNMECFSFNSYRRIFLLNFCISSQPITMPTLSYYYVFNYYILIVVLSFLYTFFIIYCNILVWYNIDILFFLFMNSMNDIIDKYSTHSKNLGKSNQQPPIDLNVC